MRPVTDPNILAQLNGGQPSQQSAPQGLRPVEDPNILAQLNSGNERSQNTPEQINQSQPESSPWWDRKDVSNRAMASFLQQQSPLGKSNNPDPGKKDYNLVENIGEGVMDFAPYLIGAGGLVKGGAALAAKSPAIAESLAKFGAKNPYTSAFLKNMAVNAPAGAAFTGANQGDQGESLAASAAASALPVALSPLVKYGAKQYAQSAIPKFTEKATEKIRGLLPSSEYATNLANKYLSAVGMNKANWKGLDKTAEALDKNVLRRTPEEIKLSDMNKLGAKLFDKSQGDSPQVAKSLHEVDARYMNQKPYLDYIGKFNEKVKGLEPSLQAPYQQSIGVAQKAAEMAPESFGGAVAASKNINQSMKDYLSEGGKAINPANRESQKFLRGLKDTIRNDLVDANKDKVGAEALSDFKTQWEGANKSHQDVLKFNKSPQKMTGVEEEGRTVRNAFKASLPKEMGGEGIPLDPSILGKYMPALTPNGAKGVQGFRQLSKLLGSKTDARDAAKSFLFQKQIGNGANTVDVAAQYAKLSEPQKKWLFGKSEEGKYLDAINRTRLAFGREPAKTAEGMGMNRHLSGMGAPALLGFGGSYYSGDSWDKSLVHGIEAGLGAKLLGYGAGRFATPKSVDRAIAMKNSAPSSGRYLNLAAQNLINQQQKGGS